MKILGVIFDENLNWKSHITLVENKISKTIGIMYKTKHLLSKKCLKDIYYSFIHSYISYCNIAWASTSSSALKKIYIKQKQASRVICNMHKCAHAKPLLREIKALNVYETNLYQNLLFMFKYQNDMLPKFFNNHFSIISHKYLTRCSIHNFNLPKSTLKKTDYSISYRGPRLWNRILDDKMKSITVIQSFKNVIKQHLLDLTDTNILLYF